MLPQRPRGDRASPLARRAFRPGNNAREFRMGSGQSRRVGWVSRAVGRRRLRGGASRAASNVFEALEGRQLFAVAIPVGGELLVNTTTAETQLVNPRGHSAAVDANGNSVIVWQSFGNDGSGDGIFGRRFDGSGAPRGAECRINSVAVNNQTLPAVATDASGDFVVAWRDLARSGDTDLGGIYARRFDADGVALGDDFLVNTTTAGDQTNPVVAMGPGGETVIAWDGPT